MLITIIATGSRGDVQPYIALGKGLKAAGYGVRIVTHEDFSDLANLHGLEFFEIKVKVADIVQNEAMSERLEKGNFISIMSQMAKEAESGAILLAEARLAA